MSTHFTPNPHLSEALCASIAASSCEPDDRFSRLSALASAMQPAAPAADPQHRRLLALVLRVERLQLLRAHRMQYLAPALTLFLRYQ